MEKIYLKIWIVFCFIMATIILVNCDYNKIRNNKIVYDNIIRFEVYTADTMKVSYKGDTIKFPIFTIKPIDSATKANFQKLLIEQLQK